MNAGVCMRFGEGEIMKLSKIFLLPLIALFLASTVPVVQQSYADEQYRSSNLLRLAQGTSEHLPKQLAPTLPTRRYPGETKLPLPVGVPDIEYVRVIDSQNIDTSSPFGLYEGQSTQYVIRLTKPAYKGIRINLYLTTYSENPNALVIPRYVTVKAGKTSVTFSGTAGAVDAPTLTFVYAELYGGKSVI